MKVLHLESIGELPEELQRRVKVAAEYVPYIKANLSEKEALERAKDADVIILAPSALKPVKRGFIDSLERAKHIALVTM